MSRPTDVRVIGARLYYLPVQTRVPLKFGTETLTSVTCARVRLTVSDRDGRMAEGWGETPLSVQWVWPSKLPYEQRHAALKRFCELVTQAWANCGEWRGHALEVGHGFLEGKLPGLLDTFNVGLVQARDEASDGPPSQPPPGGRGEEGTAPGGREERMPYLAALLCCSPFDLALHDAFAKLAERAVYATYTREFLSNDLAHFLTPAEGGGVSFGNKYPCDFFVAKPQAALPAWHLVGGMDALDESELTGDEPSDGYPVTLRQWIERDGLMCLKIKLRGNDADWDAQRIRRVGAIAREFDVKALSCDFNCTVTDPAYVNGILDELRNGGTGGDRDTYERILYVEQPFPYDLEQHRIDVHSVSARKALFMDESAHDWRLVKLGRELGWTGVALKTCKAQTGAILSACWAKAHGMALMVQDLTNPMLAQIPHVQLAAQVGTIMGVETNAMQFYPEASQAEARVHPGLYRRRGGQVDLSSIRGAGFGYRIDEIRRELPPPACVAGQEMGHP